MKKLLVLTALTLMTAGLAASEVTDFARARKVDLTTDSETGEDIKRIRIRLYPLDENRNNTFGYIQLTQLKRVERTSWSFSDNLNQTLSGAVSRESARTLIMLRRRMITLQTLGIVFLAAPVLNVLPHMIAAIIMHLIPVYAPLAVYYTMTVIAGIALLSTAGQARGKYNAMKQQMIKNANLRLDVAVPIGPKKRG
jgi:hypothetical protein